MKKVSINQLQQFVNACKWYTDNEKAETKLKMTIVAVLPKIQEKFDEYHKIKGRIDLKYANEDAKGSVIYQELPGGKREFAFTKANLPLRDAELEELFNEKRFEIEPNIVPTPKGLPLDIMEAMDGFVIELKEVKQAKEDGEPVNTD